MNKQQASAVYDILVAECGAFENGRTQFVHEMARGCREYRCCHALGFGGKFYPETMTVGYYAEHWTQARDLIQATVNQKLKGLVENTRNEG